MRHSMLSLPQLLLINSAHKPLGFLSLVRDRRSEALHEIEKDRLSDHFSKLDIYGMACCGCRANDAVRAVQYHCKATLYNHQKIVAPRRSS